MHDRFGLSAVGGRVVDVQLDLFYKLGPQFDRGSPGLWDMTCAAASRQRLEQAVALAQGEQASAEEVLLEGEEVAVICAAKTVDGLVRVADDAEIGPVVRAGAAAGIGLRFTSWYSSTEIQR